MTVYPLMDTRTSSDPATVYQLLKVVDENINNRDANLDLKCFPDIFCTGRNGQNQERRDKLQPGEYIKWLLKSTYKQFRLNLQYLFFSLDQANMRQINAGIFHKLNITKSTKNLNKKTFLENVQKNEEINNNLSTMFGRLRNTQQYWKKRNNELNCMVEHYGPATFFLILSPSEYHWNDLHEFL